MERPEYSENLMKKSAADKKYLYTVIFCLTYYVSHNIHSAFRRTKKAPFHLAFLLFNSVIQYVEF